MNTVLDTLDLIRLLVDTGLLILIWMVQLIIYPGFAFYEASDLVKWHQQYTPRITYIVAPLMLLQVALVTVQLLQTISIYTTASAFIVFLLWIVTFIYFVPRHGKIANDKATSVMVHQMIRVNWIRTFLWTILFVYSLFYSLV